MIVKKNINLTKKTFYIVSIIISLKLQLQDAYIKIQKCSPTEKMVLHVKYFSMKFTISAVLFIDVDLF